MDHPAAFRTPNLVASNGYHYATTAVAMAPDVLRDYPNAGQPWTPQLDIDVAKMNKDGATALAIAKALGRTEYAIMLRLEKHREEPFYQH